MSAYFPERVNVFIDDNIVAPLLAKEYEEADNITKTFKYDPETNLTNTTIETSLQSDHDPSYPEEHTVKKYDEVKPRSCCQKLNSAFMIFLAVGNATAWILSFVFSPFDLSDWNCIVVYVAGAVCLTTTLLMVINERRILSYPTSEYIYTSYVVLHVPHSLCSGMFSVF